MNKIVFLSMFLAVSLSGSAQIKENIRRVNLNINVNFSKPKTILAFRKNAFKFTASARANGKSIMNNNFSTALNYEFRTKIYVNNRVNFLIKSQINNGTQISTFGIIFKIQR